MSILGDFIRETISQYILYTGHRPNVIYMSYMFYDTLRREVSMKVSDVANNGMDIERYEGLPVIKTQMLGQFAMYVVEEILMTFKEYLKSIKATNEEASKVYGLNIDHVSRIVNGTLVLSDNLREDIKRCHGITIIGR